MGLLGLVVATGPRGRRKGCRLEAYLAQICRQPVYFIFTNVYIAYTCIYTKKICKNNGYSAEYPWIEVGPRLSICSIDAMIWIVVHLNVPWVHAWRVQWLIWHFIRLYDGSDKLMVFVCLCRLMGHQQLQLSLNSVGMTVSSIWRSCSWWMKMRKPSSTVCTTLPSMLQNIWVEHHTGNQKCQVWSG